MLIPNMCVAQRLPHPRDHRSGQTPIKLLHLSLFHVHMLPETAFPWQCLFPEILLEAVFLGGEPSFLLVKAALEILT